MSPTYERVERLHDHENEPRFICYQLDDGRNETRKMEVFKDGQMAKVSEDRPERASAGLVALPVPSVEEVNAIRGEGFHAEEISPAEFEDLWESSG